MADRLANIEAQLVRMESTLGRLLEAAAASVARQSAVDTRLTRVEDELINIRKFERSQATELAGVLTDVKDLREEVTALRGRGIRLGGAGALVGSVITEGTHFLARLWPFN